VNKPQTAVKEDAIRESVRTNKPYGSERWLEINQQKLGWTEPGRPGRPKKEAYPLGIGGCPGLLRPRENVENPDADVSRHRRISVAFRPTDTGNEAATLRLAGVATEPEAASYGIN
jgi:hypothetical protein